MSAFGESMALFDIRKPSIILSQCLQHYDNPSKNGEEINDFSITTHEGKTFVATCDDAGLAHVFSLDPATLELTL